jgi:hypothetical protein
MLTDEDGAIEAVEQGRLRGGGRLLAAGLVGAGRGDDAPENTVSLEARMRRGCKAPRRLEDLDDTQAVYHNAELPTQ